MRGTVGREAAAIGAAILPLHLNYSSSRDLLLGLGDGIQGGRHGRGRDPTLEMRQISKTFPGVKALNGVQLKAWGGEVQALMGENGAGKSTLMKILSGAYLADAGGEILIDGEPVQITDPIAAKRAGIAIIYQELSLAPI